MRRWVLSSLPILLAGFITYFSHQSRLPWDVALPHPLDKVVHASAFTALGLFLGLGFGQGKGWRFWLMLLGVAGLFGMADEIHQRFVPGRACEFADWVADVLGAALGLALGWVLDRLCTRRDAVS